MNADQMSGELAEEYVLGAILLDPRTFPDVAEMLTETAFGTLTHRHIFRAMQQVANRGAAPDMASVAEVLTLDGHGDMASDLAMLSFGDVMPLYVMDYARRVAHHAARRTALAYLTDLFVDLNADHEADPVEKINASLSRINEIVVDSAGPNLYADHIEAFQQRLTDQLAGLWEDPSLPTGIHDLDAAITGGFRAGELIILAARPGAGKTGLALQIMHNIARRNAPVLMFSAEMSTASLVERGMAEISGVPVSDMRKRSIDQSTYARLMTATESMARMPVAIDDTSAIKTKTMLQRAQRFKRQHGLSLVVFDYMELAGDSAGEGEQVRVTKISHALKGMAKDLEVPVIALSQLNRAVEDRNPPIPRMSDIRMSGAIEADADKILLLYRQDYYQAQGFDMDYAPEKEGVTDIIIGKQRNGEPGMVSVKFDGATMRFRNLSDPPADDYSMRTLV